MTNIILPHSYDGQDISKTSIPLQGALSADDSEEGVALRILAAKQEMMMQELRTMQMYMAQSLEASDKKFAALMQQMANQKHESAQAVEQAYQALEKLVEKKPISPEIQSEMIEDAKRQALRQAAFKHGKMKDILKNAPRKSFFSPIPGSHPVQIHGHSWVIHYGKNNNVPVPFIKEFVKRVEADQRFRQMIDTLQWDVDRDQIYDVDQFNKARSQFGGRADKRTFDPNNFGG